MAYTDINISPRKKIKTKSKIKSSLYITVIFVSFFIFVSSNFFAIKINPIKIEEIQEIAEAEEEVNDEEFEVKLPELLYINIMQKIRESQNGKTDYLNILNKQINTVDNLLPKDSVSKFGNLSPSNSSMDEINLEVNTLIQKYNEPISFIMYDLNTDSGIYYAINKNTYLASSIKLPYIASIVEETPDRFNESKFEITNILKFSSNEDYDSIRFRYGANNLLLWQNMLKIKNDVATYAYPSEVNACDILKLWFKTFHVLNSNKYSNELRELSNDSLNSAIYKAIGNKYYMNSKPGWFDCPAVSDTGYAFDGITNDCGVVYSGDNPYLLVILSELPEQVDIISNLARSIDKVHDSMVENLSQYTLVEKYSQS